MKIRATSLSNNLNPKNKHQASNRKRMLSWLIARSTRKKNRGQLKLLGIWIWTKMLILYDFYNEKSFFWAMDINKRFFYEDQLNLNRSTVRTSDFKSENLGSIPSRGVFYHISIPLHLFISSPAFILSSRAAQPQQRPTCWDFLLGTNSWWNMDAYAWSNMGFMGAKGWEGETSREDKSKDNDSQY